jgi:hypothetical protein
MRHQINLLLLAAIALFASGCSTALGNNSADPVIQAAGILTVAPAGASVPIGQTLQLSTTGGASPYIYHVTSGTCAITTVGGLLTTGTVAETCIVTVSDAADRTGELSVSIITSGTVAWVQSGFGACSNVCGGGTQTQTVTCQDGSGNVVANSECTGAEPAISQTCNTQQCGYGSWAISSSTSAIPCSEYGITSQLAGGTLTVYLPQYCNQGTSCVFTNAVVKTPIVYTCQ